MSRPIGRTYFFNLNAHKRSMSVNTRTPEGKEVAQKVAATADVLLANMRPGATERMGIGPEVLKTLNPRIIETHVTGYGWRGPYAHRPGIDPLAQALMGLQRAQGGPGNPPVFPAQLAPTDFTTGAMGALGTILALFVRERTGVVQRVDSNLLNGGIILSSEWFTRYAGKPTRRLADKGQYGLDALPYYPAQPGGGGEAGTVAGASARSRYDHRPAEEMAAARQEDRRSSARYLPTLASSHCLLSPLATKTVQGTGQHKMREEVVQSCRAVRMASAIHQGE